MFVWSTSFLSSAVREARPAFTRGLFVVTGRTKKHFGAVMSKNSPSEPQRIDKILPQLFAPSFSADRG
jgi:hypothetical protein